MKGSIKLKLDSIVKGLKGKGSLKDLLNSGAKKTDQQEKPAHKLSQDMDSEEQRQAEALFENIDLVEQKDEKPEGMQDEASQLKSILRQDKQMGEETDKKDKSVSFYEEGRPIYEMTADKKWNEEVKHQRKGKFDSHEQRVLCDAVGQFLATNEIDVDEFKKMISDGSNSVLKKQKFFKLLSNVLPTRSQESCYKYILRQFHTMNHKGAWTEEEVDQLLALIDKFGKKWKMIGKEMNRTSDNVYDKYRSLGDDVHGDRVKSIWKIHELLTLLTEIENESKVQFLSKDIKSVLAKEQEHDEYEMKDLESHKYNSKHFVFHNIEVLMPFVNSKSIKSVSLEKLRWRKIVRHIATKSIFDCRNKFVQILQMVFRSTEGLDEVLIKFLEKQNVKEESSVNWKKWKPKEFTPEEARNRLMILKKLIEGRSNKEFAVILHEIRNKVNKRLGLSE